MEMEMETCFAHEFPTMRWWKVLQQQKPRELHISRLTYCPEMGCGKRVKEGKRAKCDYDCQI